MKEGEKYLKNKIEQEKPKPVEKPVEKPVQPIVSEGEVNNG